MKILNFEIKKRRVESKQKSVIPAVSNFFRIFGGGFFGRNESNREKYKEWVSFCINTIANEVTNAEIRLMKPNADGEPKKILKHQLIDLLKKPNKEMTGLELMEWISSDLDLDGNCFLAKIMVAGKTRELWPLRSDWMTIIPEEDGSRMIKGYKYARDGLRDFMMFEPDEIIHIRNYNPFFYNRENPYKGIGKVELARLTIDEDMTIKEWNSKFFMNGAIPEGVLEYDGVLSNEQKRRVETKWKNTQAGLNNKDKVPLLQGGLRFKRTGLSQKDLAFIENRKLDRDDIFTLFGLPKALFIGDDANLANAKMALWIFTRFTIKSKLKRIEAFLNAHLVSEYGDNLTLEFPNPVPEDRELILKEKSTALGGGSWMTVNEVRAMEGLEPIDGGDVLSESKIESNDDQKKTSKSVINEREERGEKAWKKMIKNQELWEDKYSNTLGKYFSELGDRVKRAYLSGKSVKSPMDVIDRGVEVSFVFDLLDPLQREYFEEEYRRAFGDIEQEVVEIDFDSVLTAYTKKLSKQIIKTTADNIAEVISIANDEGIGPDETSRRLEKYFTDAEKNRAQKIARTETIRTSNRATEMAWDESGVVEAKEWFTAKDERVCPYCNSMDGKTIKIGENFFDKGDDLLGMKFDYEDVKTPPLHPLCRCVIIPVIKK